jgi:hypothetical protein
MEREMPTQKSHVTKVMMVLSVLLRCRLVVYLRPRAFFATWRFVTFGLRTLLVLFVVVVVVVVVIMMMGWSVLS